MAETEQIHRAPHILVVEDNQTLLRSFSGLLRSNGMSVHLAPDGMAAVELVAQSIEQGRPYDAVLSDIAMPRMDGVSLLRATRTHDLDVPVVLITGQPSLDSAIRAVELGAHRYLFKPVAPELLVQTLRAAARFCLVARSQRAAAGELGLDEWAPMDIAGSEALLSDAIRSLSVHYEPIVRADGQPYGQEALMRCSEIPFPTRKTLVAAARRLGRHLEIQHAMQTQVARELERLAEGESVFLNLETEDLKLPQARKQLSALHAVAGRLVLQLTDGCRSGELVEITELLSPLREQGFRISVSNLGSAYAGLSMFVQLKPDFVKLDDVLSQDVHASATKQRLIRSVAHLCHDLNVCVIAGGVLDRTAADTLVDLGVDLFQGELFCGTPLTGTGLAPPFSAPRGETVPALSGDAGDGAAC